MLWQSLYGREEMKVRMKHVVISTENNFEYRWAENLNFILYEQGA